MTLRDKLFTGSYTSIWDSVWDLVEKETRLIGYRTTIINKSVVVSIQITTYRSVEMSVLRKVESYAFTS